MTLSPDDLAAMGERHRPQGDTELLRDWCWCGEPWPCEVRPLLDEVEALREFPAEIVGGAYSADLYADDPDTADDSEFEVAVEMVVFRRARARLGVDES